MERKPGARQIPSDDREWWTAVDESYWQVLLEQGEVAPEITPPANFHEPLSALGAELETQQSASQSDTERQQDSALNEEWQAACQALDQGETFHLKVSGANRGGLLVSWNGMQGFVPASHLIETSQNQDAHERMLELSERIGDSLTVRLIEVNAQQNRLVFSERAALASPQSPASILQTLRPGDVCRGTVTNLTTFGAFVDLGGVEGLVHISEISWDRVRHPGDALDVGQEVDVHVLGVNPDQRRIALSLKRLRADPWKELEMRYQIDQIIEGTVTNVVNFGAFVRVEEGVEGLIHISELAEGNFLHPRNVVREGDTVRVRVLSIDAERHRMGLSLRQAHGTQTQQ
jgi:small subunit ribosomal protein S1